jgi:hypothetical protein
MNKDLRELNRAIAAFWIGKLDRDQEAYIENVPVCIGAPAYSAHDLEQLLRRLRGESWGARSVGDLNSRYLEFARLAARDNSDEGVDLLLRLGLNLKLAEYLRSIPDAELELLAFGSAGPMMRCPTQSFRLGVKLHKQAAKHHAAALITALESSEQEAS